MDTELDAINAAADLVAQAEQALRYVPLITPLDADRVRREFLAGWAAGRPVNPRLAYPAADPAPAAAAIAAARNRLPHDPFWHDLLARELDHAESALRALTTRDPAEMTGYAMRVFGAPTPTAVAEARRYLAEHPADEHPPAADWTADRAADAMRTVLAEAGLAQWSVEQSEHLAERMSVVAAESTVRVKRGAVFTAAEVRRLIVHEIGTHVLRAANGRHQALRILGHGLSDSAPAEEGLAVWHEHRAGVADVDAMRRNALRVLACQAALGGDFRTVFAQLVPHTSPDEAFSLTLRVKRGPADTAAPGGYLKEHVYFMEFLTVGAHLAAHPGHHDLLMAGRWSLSGLDALLRWQDGGLLAEPAYRLERVVELAGAVV
ncbi:hypothetical protein Cs7R123_29500 [Catellatospora sp. TT07R-123]|uniref:tyrosine/phenylalanine carboxypeptidase domain-containing protein n=1 Tax=Catellatospora sp. TT07R-123 TaxID=2733863 RepID=UPI001B1BD158|nr:tyrosine/phenylalanine carboxypeptidase domain-containing protein [Catellatospora sp. TT07R-123]GHJ45608.1 hypothetical protein Cs7R123_29500 [Catellatospora sp. TT07R-123]